MSQVITRFAPSPTGLIHLGNIRTAIFNWLYAKSTGGKFLLRIEDTDKKRSTEEATQAILTALQWLGLNWDGITYQSRAQNRHIEVANQLLAAGKAYKCYTTLEELDEFRHKNPNKKFRSIWRNSTDPPSSHIKPTIRLRIDEEKTSVINDLIQGEVSINNSELDDMILLRSDQTPTYLLAAVVDDHDMGITHVLRGTDHLTNAFRQMQIIDALGWQQPKYGHIPLIHNAEGGKMSKRSGDMDLSQYIKQEYLPEAIFNYLLRLGWSYGDKEIFSMQEAIDLFSLKGIGKSPAKFDQDKLSFYNTYYLQHSEQINAYIKQELGGRNLINIEKAIKLIKERSTTKREVTENIKMFVSKHTPLCDKSANIIAGEGSKIIKEFYPYLEKHNKWEQDELKSLCKGFAGDKGYKLGVIMQTLRAYIIGTFDSPGILEMMEILGKDECMNRINLI